LMSPDSQYSRSAIRVIATANACGWGVSEILTRNCGIHSGRL
jgi:hypothetical protein